MNFFKKNWLYLAFAAVLIAVFKYRSSIATRLSGLPASVKTFLQISGFVVPLGFVLLHGDAVLAACAAGLPCAAHDVGLWSRIVGWLTMLAAGTGGLAITAFTAPDTVDAYDALGGRAITYTPGDKNTEVDLYINVPKNRTGGANPRPLIAVDTQIAIDTVVTQGTAGNPIAHDDLARLLSSVVFESPDLGTLLDEATGTGPILDLIISYLANGFNRPDAPIASLALNTSAGTTDYTLTKYFTYPWAQRFLADPASSCPWLGMIDKTRIHLKIAPTTCLVPVSSSAVVDSPSVVRAATSYVAHSHWFYPNLGAWRVDHASSGSDGMTFQNFGQTGASGTRPLDYLHTLGILSSLKGLPGSLTFDSVVQIVAAQFGLDDILNVDEFVLARFRAQYSGSAPPPDFTNDGNHAAGTPNGGAGLAGLLCFLLKQPSLDMRKGNMPALDSTANLVARFAFATPRVGQDAFISGSLREIAQSKVPVFAARSGGLLPASVYAPARPANARR